MRDTRTSSRLISIKVPSALRARLVSVARKRRSTLSAVAREALEAYGEGEQHSFGSLARDLCGSLSGPADLSTNRKHLKGYGE